MPAATRMWWPCSPRLRASPFGTRLDVCRTDLVAALEAVYGDGTDIDGLSERAAHIALAAAAERPEELRLLDRRREVDRSGSGENDGGYAVMDYRRLILGWARCATSRRSPPRCGPGT